MRHLYAYTTLPNILELRTDLRLAEVNTGRTIISRHGPVSDDMERLYAMLDEHERVLLMSGVEFEWNLYRGQCSEHSPCVPNLGRLKRREEELLALCRAAAFEDAVAAHPMVATAAATTFLDKPLAIDRAGLVQHYGLATDMLDLTSNFDVASFFATCRWDDNRCRYQPMDSVGGPGVIYHLHGAAVPLERLRIVGWQPLPRPAEQKAFAIQLRRGEDFLLLPGVGKRNFRHSLRMSRRIWKAFDEGGVLFPTDAVAEVSMRAKRLFQFSRSQIDRAWAGLEAWVGEHFRLEARTKMEASTGLLTVDLPILNWNGLDEGDRDENVLRERMDAVLSEVRFRWTAPHYQGQ